MFLRIKESLLTIPTGVLVTMDNQLAIYISLTAEELKSGTAV